MTSKEVRYKYYLTRLYNHAFPDEQVARNHVFSNEELFRITPQHIYSFFTDLAYGTPAPTLNDTPKIIRSATLEFAKKAISSFQPNQLLPWNEQSGSGNPTCSALVNDLIKLIKKEEVSVFFYIFILCYL